MPYSGLLDTPVVCDDLDTPLPYSPEAILFDGSTDRMERGADLTGIATGKQGILSSWIRLDGLFATVGYLFASVLGGQKVLLRRTITDELIIVVRNAAGTNILTVQTGSMFLSGSPWFHYLSSWSLEAGRGDVFVDGVQDENPGKVITDDTIQYPADDWVVGAQTLAGAQPLMGALADFYFTTEFLDLTVEANVRKFIDASGNPVFLGSSGETPTGTPSLIYLRGTQANQGLNSGTGGDFVSQGTQVPGETPGPVVGGTSSPPAIATVPHSWNGL